LFSKVKCVILYDNKDAMYVSLHDECTGNSHKHNYFNRGKRITNAEVYLAKSFDSQ
jgi:hypothetical protein